MLQKIKNWLFNSNVQAKDEDFYSLDMTFAKFILPRLMHFKNLEGLGFPGKEKMTMKKWQNILDKMIFAMEYCAGEDQFEDIDPKMEKIVQEGLNLFGQYFRSLWY